MIFNRPTKKNRFSAALHKVGLPGFGLAVFLLASGSSGLAAQDAETIKKINVVGAQKLTKENLLFRIGLKEGDDIRTIDFSSVLEKIWAIGTYDDVKIKFMDEDGGKVLIIEVVERPIVKEVDYRGGTQVRVSTIKDKVKEDKLEIAPDTIYDPDAARKIKSKIVDLAAEKGFNDPIVDVVLEPMGAGICRLVFDIKEGGKARIYKINLLGNTVLTDRQIKGAFGKMKKTREHWSFSWLTSHDLLVDKNLDEDIQKLKDAYLRLGYKDVFVGQPIKEIQDHTSPRQKAKNVKLLEQFKSPKYDLRTTLTFHVLEGERYYEGKLAFEGNNKVPGLRGEMGEARFRRAIGEARRDNRSWLAKFFNIKVRTEDLPPSVNKPMDFHAMNKGMENIGKIYRGQAYANIQLNPVFEVREENNVNKVDTTVKIAEGEMFHVRRVEFRGNDTTLDKVLRRAAMPLTEGSPFSFEIVQDSVLGLNQLGFFEVKPPNFPNMVPVDDKPLVDVIITGEEAGVNEIMFTGGYGGVFGLSLGASLSTKNLGGGGESLGLSVNGGEFQRSVTVSYMQPYVMDKPFSLGASISDNSSEYSARYVGPQSAYKLLSRGLGLSSGTRLSTFMPSDKWGGWTTRTQLGIGYSMRLMTMEGGQNYYFRSLRSQMTSTVNVYGVYNTVNHPFKPTRGFKFGVGFEYGGWQFATDRPFHRVNIDSSYFKDFAERHIFAFNVSYGYLANLGEVELPIWDNFRPGGETSIRGYRFGYVGTFKLDNMGTPVIVGGNKQFLANIEYQLKIAEEFRALIFYDMGNAWAPGYKVFSEALRRSVGVEARFFLPISPAPIRLIWARKLNPYIFDYEGKTQFQFSMGTTF